MKPIRGEIKENMAKEDERKYVSELIDLYYEVSRVRWSMHNSHISNLTPLGIWNYCVACSESYFRFVLLPSSKSPDRLVSRLCARLLNLVNVLSNSPQHFPQGFDGKFDFSEHKKNVPLNIWGHVLDVWCGILDETKSTAHGDKWKRFCRSMFDEKGDFTKWRVKKAEQNHNIKADFLIKSSKILDQIKIIVEKQASNIDVNKYPDARLMVVEQNLARFEMAFFKGVSAIGPYSPSANAPGYDSSYLLDADRVLELGSEPGILQIREIERNAKCIFKSISGKTHEWEIDTHRDTIAWNNELGRDYWWMLFGTWSYKGGEFLGYLDYDPEISAHWFVNDSLSIDVDANMTVEKVCALMANKDYESLANRAIKIVRNNQHVWCPGRIRWSYVQELDEIIRAFEEARRLFGLKLGIPTPTISIERQRLQIKLSDTEENIIEALGTETLTAEKLAKRLKYPCNSNFKNTLSSLRKRGILDNRFPEGYFLPIDYRFLVSTTDESQD